MASTGDVLNHHLKCFGEGEFACILWSAGTADNVYEVGTDTFVVRDGTIVAQSLAARITPRGWRNDVVFDRPPNKPMKLAGCAARLSADCNAGHKLQLHRANRVSPERER